MKGRIMIARTGKIKDEYFAECCCKGLQQPLSTRSINSEAEAVNKLSLAVANAGYEYDDDATLALIKQKEEAAAKVKENADKIAGKKE